MIWAGGVAGGGTDSSVFLLNEFGVVELVEGFITPLDAGLLVHVLRQGLCEAVCKGFRHDDLVVVILRLKLGDQFGETAP